MAFDFLGKGQTLTVTYDVSVADSHGGTASQNVVITITGTNDAVSITSGAQTGSVIEDSATAHTQTGTIAFTDADLTDGHVASLTASPSSSLGTFALAPVAESANAANGSVGWTYTLDDSKAQSLAAGQKVTETYTVTVDDQNGSTTTQDVVITITGTNDAVSITSGAQGGSVIEDSATAHTQSGTIAFTDADLSDTHAATFAAAAGNATSLGTFALAQVAEAANAANGSVGWTYTLDDSKAQYLAAGQQVTETYTVTVTDDKGDKATQDVVITITGTNDAPVISSEAQDGSVNEDTTLTVSGQVTSSDVDHDATAAYSGNAPGDFGSFAIDASSGVWTYTLDNAHQDLAAGESHTETFTVTVTDDKGDKATQDVVITITGTNDAPVISSEAQNGSVNEDTTLTVTGQVTSSDVDRDATAAYSGNAPGNYGSFAVDANSGVWTYTMDNTHQDLAAGESHTETFTVTVTDDKGDKATQDVVITVTGTNDAPVITSEAQNGSVKEDTQLVATGQVTSSDVDHDATAAYSGNAAGTYGSFAVDASSGMWTYTLDNAHQDLAAGESHTETFAVTVTDDKGDKATQDVVITITGTNDAPVISSEAQNGSVKEDTQLVATGQVTSSDVDHDATAAYSGNAAGTYGSFAVDASSGMWTYTLDNAHQDLAAGESHTETFTVTVTDDHGDKATQDVVITITGTNDAPVISSEAQNGSVKEDTQLVATGQVTSSDVDHDATAAYSGNAAGTYGSFAVDASSGVWTYTLDNAHQDLAAGESHTETFTVTVTDDNGDKATQDVVITVTGTNDAPVITSEAQNGSVKEDTQLVATGQVTSSDVDHDATAAYSGNAAGTYGSFAVDASTGVWTYTLDNTHQDLAAGESHTETFTVTVTDDKGDKATQDVVITITGTNDAPVISSEAQDGSVNEDTTLTVSGQVTSSDVDHDATAAYSGNAAGTYGSFAVDASTGVWTYTLDNTHQDLAAGESHTETFTVTVTDDKGDKATQDVVITITGTNDAPVISSEAQNGSVKEDTQLVATGQVTSSDVDHDATAAYSGNAAGTYGSFAVDASSGMWTYTLDNAHQDLAAGESHTETFTVTVTDDKGDKATQDVVITITGTNDAPVISSEAQDGSVKEDTQLVATGQVTSSDVDHDATAAYSGNAAGTYGSFAVDASSGVWTYTLDNTHQDLAAGESHTETFTVTVTDDKGDKATQDVVITITGTNDAPVISSEAQNGSVKEDTQLVATGQVTSSDVDHDATAAYSGNAAGTYGSFAVDASSGVWTYTLDNTHQDLAAGESHTETFTVTVTDDKGDNATQDVVITITGTNDAPVISSEAQNGSVKEDTQLVATGQLTSSDVDHDATAAYSGNAAGTYGSFAVDASTGVWTYTLDNTHQDLAAGESHTETFTVTVTDDHGDKATQDVVITITGTNDAPVISSEAQDGSVKEDTTLTVTGQVTSSDVDHDATAAYSGNAPGNYGSFAVDASTGVWTYTLDNTHQDLAAGESHTETFTVTVTDDKGDKATQDVVITITGTNDAPVITSEAQNGSVNEDTTLTVSGQVTSSDVDHDATAAYSGNAPGTYGSFAVDASSGVWTYTLDNTHQDLAEGESHTETFTVTVTDDKGDKATQDVVITITGTNDAPVAVVDTKAVHEDAILTGTVASNDSDADNGALLSYINEPVAGLTLAADGSYSFDAGNAAYQHLAEGATADVVAHYRVTDEHGATSISTLTITLTGTNDAPIALADSNSGLEDATITGSVAGNDSDVDDSAGLRYNLDAAVAGLTFNADGSYSFDASNAAYQHLGVGDTANVVAHYTVTDEHEATSTSTLTIALTGTNDAPRGMADIKAGNEDTTITGTVATNDSDIDDGAALTYALDAPVPGLAIAADGSYSFDAGNAAYQHLAAGATTDVVAHYTVTDEHGATSSSTLTIALTGTNDAPVAVFDAAAGMENQALTINALANDTDADDSHLFTLSSVSAPSGKGTASAVENKVVFTPGSDFDHLAEGEQEHVTLSYAMQDEHGAISTSTVGVTITGTNDAPVITAGGTLAYTERQAAATINATLTVSDLDSATLTGATVSISGGFASGQDVLAVTNQNGINGSYNSSTGVLTLSGSSSVANYQAALRSVTYSNSSDNPSTAARTISFEVDDGSVANHTSNVATTSITVAATNDAPVVSAVVINGTTISFVATDVDNPTLSLANPFAPAFGNPSIASGVTNNLMAVEQASSAVSGTLQVTDGTVAADVVGLYLGTGSNNTATAPLAGSTNAMYGFGGDDALTGGAAADRIFGGSGNDTMVGGGGADILIGDVGNDTITYETGATIHGDAASAVAGTNSDTLVLTQAVNISLSLVNQDTSSGSTVTGFENVDASTVSSAVVLTGSSGANTLKGGSGADTITGGAGADTISAGAGSDTINLANGDFAAGESIDGGAGTTDAIVLTNATTINFSTGAVSNVETLTGGTGADTVTMSATQWAGFSNINLGITGANVLNVVASGNVSALVTPTVANVTTGNLIGTSGADSVTLSGAQLDAIVIGAGTINLGAGTGDTINLTSTSTDLNTLGDASIQGVETISAAAAAAGVTINISAQTEAFAITGSSNGDTLAGGSGADTINGGGGDDILVGRGGNDNLTGSSGNDQFRLRTDGGTDVITDYTDGTDKIGFLGSAVTGGFAFAGTTATSAGATLNNGSLNVRASINALGNNDDSRVAVIGSTQTRDQIMAASGNNGNGNQAENTYVVVFNSNTGKGEIWFDDDWSTSMGRVQVATLNNVTTLAGVTAITASDIVVYDNTIAPAGIAGSPINLGLAASIPDHLGDVSVTVTGVPVGWTLSTGTDNGDGTWTVQTNDPGALTVTTDAGFRGALVLPMTLVWTNPDGTSGGAVLDNNIEAYAPGSPIFALSTDDNLTGSSGDDLFVFAQPIARDVIYSFDAAHDKIDLIGFTGVDGYGDLSITDDANDNAVITLANGSTITVVGVHAASLTADHFVFNVAPTTNNTGTMTISDGAMMPFGGVLNNTGTIELQSAGSDTRLDVLVESLTLQGGGQLTLSDSDHNIVVGGASSARLVNIDNTISGAGQIGAGQMTLDNHGTIVADGSHALVIDTGANTVANAGTLAATGSGGLVINSALDNSGILWANGGDVTVHGNVNGSGSAQISGSAALTLDGAANVAVSFDQDGAGALKLGDADHFSGSIAGFGGNNALHLADIAVNGGTTIAYAADASGSGGVLTLGDGSNLAYLALQGSYDHAGFHGSADQAGGMRVTANVANANQDLHGGAGIDILVTGAGDDILAGGAGNDLLFGGGGADTFVFDSAPDGAGNFDTVLDFKANGDADHLLLSQQVFDSLFATDGSLDATQFAEVGDGSGGSVALDAAVHVIYDSQTGNLYYDADGADTVGGRTVFAVLGGTEQHPASIDHHDIKLG